MINMCSAWPYFCLQFITKSLTDSDAFRNFYLSKKKRIDRHAHLDVIQLKQCGVDSDFFLPKANLSLHELFKTIYCQLCYEAFIQRGRYFHCILSTKCVHKLVYINFYDANFLYMYCHVSSHFPNVTRSD